MEQNSFFESVVEPSIERLGIYGIAHDVNFDGRHFVVSHKVSKNVMTDFDKRLSKYLAAVTGVGLPGATVETRIRDVETGRSWSPYPARHLSAMPEALATAVRLSLGSEEVARVRLGAWMSDDKALERDRELTVDAAMGMEEAVNVCKQIGPTEFLDVSGDLDRIILKPTGAKLDMLQIDLHRGTVAVPTTTELGGIAWQGALYGFEQQARTTPAVASYLARARYEVSIAKEEAIYAFREAAESRIADFNGALAGRELSGYRLESARSLVSRLQAGLGDTLLGLSEAAQLTALDWAMEVRHLPQVGKSNDDPNRPPRPRLVQ